MFWQRSLDFTASTASPSFTGKQRKFPNSASDSGSCSSDTTEGDKLMFGLGWRSSKQSTGATMKKLLAQEMSKENESRRRPLSVIARLMGVDGLPPLQPNHKQRKRTQISQAKVQNGGTFSSRQSSRKCSKEEQEFKDVFEVLDAAKVETGGYSSQGAANSKVSDVQLAFIQKKFMEGEGLSPVENLLDSGEFKDTLEVVDSNADILVKFLHQPDSLFTKHLDDLQVALPQSRCSRFSTMKSSHTLKNQNVCLGQKAGRETQLKCPQQHQEDILNQSYGRYAAHNRLKAPKVQLEEKNGPPILPTTIVVLKPSLGKSQNSALTASSPCSSHHPPSGSAGNSGILNREAELWREKKVHQDIEFSIHNSKESRKIAREITRQMKNRFSNGSIKISTSRFRGYAGNVNSCDVSGSESANDSDVKTVSYTDNMGWNKQHRRSSSGSSESSLSREAKKRLSERWKQTHRPQEVDLISMGSTLGEMLAISEKEVSPANSSSGFGEEGCSEFGNHVKSAVWNEPLGISSRDCWKDGCLGSLSRPPLVPTCSTDFGSLRINTNHGTRCIDRREIRKDGSKREASLPSNQRFRVKKSRCPISSCSNNRENNDTSLDSLFTPYQLLQNSDGDNQSEDNLMVSGASACTTRNSTSVLENAVDANNQNKVVLSEPLHKDLSASTSANAVVSTGDLDNLDSQEPSEGPSKQATSHCPVPEQESRLISNEADQPSPVSIIETPFTEDFSSGSECFESISADLQSLRMQLQLLKLESEAYEEGIMLLSSEDEGDEVSIGFTEDKGIPKAEEDWESMYIDDILVESGINGADLDTFLARCHSPECPVNPLTFEELEKKYGNLNSSSRAERRLMFDRINSKLGEIYQQYMKHHLHPRVKSVRKWSIEDVEDSLRKSLVSQNMDAGKTVLAGECQWLESSDNMDVIGREIEIWLVDELVAEVVKMLSVL
ncbi:hypothetical protein ES332_D04G147700v1 [Gossypium tomentosum]|uniref:DUF4378 domain-containing protein n=1 Tax=Gossypium tomentosum TaxID=34277 RepID=A0A5D2LDC6_GOSTO|nr:hypothetical protein ES332_D04G147700v1 [Gossypium tomentosum]